MNGRYQTNQSRPDVNNYYSTSGNHGFQVLVPAQYRDRNVHRIQIYAVDFQNPAAGSLNSPLLFVAPEVGPQASTSVVSHVFYGDTQIFGAYVDGGYGRAGSVRVATSGQLAGAIDSLSWGGEEFINRWDHGREMQTALFGVRARNQPTPTGNPTTDQNNLSNYALRYNPTEAGSSFDLYKPSSTSYLAGINRPQSNRITTNTQLAYWTPAGQTSDAGPSINTPSDGDPSQYRVSKSVQIDNNIVHNVSTVSIPASDDLRYIQLFAPILYTQSNLTTSLTYNFQQRKFVADTAPSGFRPQVVARATGAGAGDFTIAVITRMVGRQIPGLVDNGYRTSGTTVQGNTATEPTYGFMFRDFVYKVPLGQSVSGDYQFESYVFVGTRALVEANLNQYASDPSNTNFFVN